MIWLGEGLIIATRKFSETSLIITLFTLEKGVFRSLVRGGQSKKKLAIFQSGNLISAIWKARLEEQLGTLTNESIITNYNAKFFYDKHKVLAFKTILELLNITIKNGEDYQNLYHKTIDFFNILVKSPLLLEDYINYELYLLAELGYGIDLSKCAVTGKVDNLYYISPNTGNAVIKSIGDKYQDKLLHLPSFLGAETDQENDLEKSFRLTEYFMQKHILSPYNIKLPFARLQLEKEFKAVKL